MNRDSEYEPDLIGRYLAGVATESEVARLESLLMEDSGLRREFLRYARIDSALGAMRRPVAGDAQVITPEGSRWRGSVLWAIAAVLLVGLGFFWMSLGRSGVDVEVLATSGPAAVHWKAGNHVFLKTIGLSDGGLQLRLSSGVTLDLVGPVELGFLDSMQIRVLSGHVTADVGSAGKGFVIQTVSARIVDLGTRFGVGVSVSGETDVAVFQGKVEVYQPDSAGSFPTQLASLEAGEAVRITSRWEAQRLAAVALQGGSLAILNAKSLAPGVVGGVSDNLGGASFHRFYTLISGGMKPGVRPYSTLGSPRWSAMPGKDFPAELLGGDVVGTFSPDRLEYNLQLSLHCARPCTVYLLQDIRSSEDGLRAQGFANTGLYLRSGPWSEGPGVRDLERNANGEIYVTYAVWRKEQSTAGIFTIEPFPRTQESRRHAMYGVVVKGLP